MQGLQDMTATKQKGTEKKKQKRKRKKTILSLLSMWRGGSGRHVEQKGARYLSQPVWSDISSPGKTEAAGSAAGSAAGAVSSACATFGKTFETYLTSSTRPAARPGQSPSVRAASAFSPGFPWWSQRRWGRRRRRPGP